MWRTSNTNIGMHFPTVDECCCCELGSFSSGRSMWWEFFWRNHQCHQWITITNVARTCSLTHSVLFPHFVNSWGDLQRWKTRKNTFCSGRICHPGQALDSWTTPGHTGQVLESSTATTFGHFVKLHTIWLQIAPFCKMTTDCNIILSGWSRKAVLNMEEHTLA